MLVLESKPKQLHVLQVHIMNSDLFF